MAYDDEDVDAMNHIVISSEQHAGDSAQLMYFIPRPDAIFVHRRDSVFIQAKLTVHVTEQDSGPKNDVSTLTLYEVSEEKQDDIVAAVTDSVSRAGAEPES